MRQLKKFSVLFLPVLLLAVLSAGCGKPGVQATPTPPAEEDVTYELTGLARDTVLFTVDGAEVTAEQYLFWLSQSVSYMDQTSRQLGREGINWEEEMSGLTVADYCRNDAMETSKLYALVELHAAQQGCTLSQENELDLQGDLDAMIEQLGGEEQYELLLSRIGLSREGMLQLNRVGYLYDNLQDGMFGRSGQQAPTDESMDAYIAEQDLLAAKHILLLTVDMKAKNAETGEYERLTDDVIAQKRAQAEQLLSRLRESGDPAALFDTLMQEYSEDSGLSANPDGYVFTAGEMVTEFETAARMLEFGEISDVVESKYGLHIILRQDPDSEKLRGEWAVAQMHAVLDQWVTNAVVKTNDAYESVDPRDYYDRLLVHQAEIDERMQADRAEAASPDATASPGGSAP